MSFLLIIRSSQLPALGQSQLARRGYLSKLSAVVVVAAVQTILRTQQVVAAAASIASYSAHQNAVRLKLLQLGRAVLAAHLIQEIMPGLLAATRRLARC
jgi:hypothetical protein